MPLVAFRHSYVAICLCFLTPPFCCWSLFLSIPLSRGISPHPLWPCTTKEASELVVQQFSIVSFTSNNSELNSLRFLAVSSAISGPNQRCLLLKSAAWSTVAQYLSWGLPSLLLCLVMFHSQNIEQPFEKIRWNSHKQSDSHSTHALNWHVQQPSSVRRQEGHSAWVGGWERMGAHINKTCTRCS